MSSTTKISIKSSLAKKKRITRFLLQIHSVTIILQVIIIFLSENTVQASMGENAHLLKPARCIKKN